MPVVFSGSGNQELDGFISETYQRHILKTCFNYVCGCELM